MNSMSEEDPESQVQRFWEHSALTFEDSVSVSARAVIRLKCSNLGVIQYQRDQRSQHTVRLAHRLVSGSTAGIYHGNRRRTYH